MLNGRRSRHRYMLGRQRLPTLGTHTQRISDCGQRWRILPLPGGRLFIARLPYAALAFRRFFHLRAQWRERSSVAETTGKRTTSRHPKASRQCRKLTFRAGLRPHHSHQAGTASNSHTRLSNSSICYGTRTK